MNEEQKKNVANLVINAWQYMLRNEEDALDEEQLEDLYRTAGELYDFEPIVVTVIDSMLPDIYETFKKSGSDEAIKLVIEAIEEESR